MCFRGMIEDGWFTALDCRCVRACVFAWSPKYKTNMMTTSDKCDGLLTSKRSGLVWVFILLSNMIITLSLLHLVNIPLLKQIFCKLHRLNSWKMSEI